MRFSLKLVFFLVMLGVMAPVESSYAGSCSSLKKQVKKVCAKKSRVCRKSSQQLNACLARAAKTANKKAVCFTLYDPVCGKSSSGQFVTYSNSCEAASVNATVLFKGACFGK